LEEKALKIFTLAMLGLCLGLSATAGSVVVAPGGDWIGLNSPVIRTGFAEQLAPSSGASTRYDAYWNNNTLDGNTCANVGCFITKQGAFASTATSPDLDNAVWLGDAGAASGQRLDKFSFNAQPDGNTRILIELAGQSTSNWFGWYDSSFAGPFDSTNEGTRWGIIFDGNDSPTAALEGSKSSTSFLPTQNFGFWFLPKFTTTDFDRASAPKGALIANASTALNSGNAVFTESGRNKGFDNRQYFALFAESEAVVNNPPTEFWMGIEDLKAGDFDYNDMVVKFKLTSFVPEPGFYGALALGLGALFISFRSKRQN
jgi:hypothetical protein